MSSIGGRISQIRKINGLNQPDFAKAIKISSGYISEIEQGNKMPSTEILEAVRKKFGVTANWLTTGKGWTIDPGGGSDTINAVTKFKKLLVQKIIIIIYYGRFGTEVGFLIDTSDGLCSISGSATRTDHLGGGRNAYCDVLEIFGEQKYSLFKLEVKEALDWQSTDLVKFASRQSLPRVYVKDELHAMKPHMYPAASEEHLSDDTLKLEELINRVKKNPELLDTVLKVARKNTK